jgi:hypothetical protein
MASSFTSPTFSSFTITQPFLGAPLQFSPALGSQELEQLVDAYVIGSACKQDKLSQVTIDFYKYATVDLNTGALTKTYDVYFSAPWVNPSFEASPAQSLSSGFSPSFTQSPASALGDSGHGSISMTPPTRTGRVTKKAKKDTKKVAEMRLPGFSIMTKDGVDVTNTAGRGTKTKEQREHAHLMRQLKACDSCKRKKVKCDPAHRIGATDMSRTSTTTSKGSSSQHKPSPASSAPSLTRQTTQGTPPAFSPSNVIDDFVLFPEDNLSWNPADISFSELETQDLGQFNFDINDIGFSVLMSVDNTFDFSPFEQPANNFHLDNQLGYSPPISNGYGLEQWDSPQSASVSHSRPHPSGGNQDSGQVESFNSPLASASFSHSLPHLSGVSHDSGQLEPLFQSNFLGDSVSQSSAGLSGELLQSKQPSANGSPMPSFSSDWSMLEPGVIANASPQGEMSASTPASQPSVSRKRSRSTDQPGIEDEPFRHKLVAGLTAASHAGVAQSSSFSALIDPSGSPVDPNPRRQPIEIPSYQKSHSSSSGSSSSGGIIASYIYDLHQTCHLVSGLLESRNSSSVEYSSLNAELKELQPVLAQLGSGHGHVLAESVVSQLRSLAAQLSVLSSHVNTHQSGHQRYNKLDPELRPEYLRQCQAQARRLIRSLCATINTTEAQNSGTSPTGNAQTLTTGRNLQIFLKSSSFNGFQHPEATDMTDLQSSPHPGADNEGNWTWQPSVTSISSLDTQTRFWFPCSKSDLSRTTAYVEHIFPFGTQPETMRIQSSTVQNVQRQTRLAKVTPSGSILSPDPSAQTVDQTQDTVNISYASMTTTSSGRPTEISWVQLTSIAGISSLVSNSSENPILVSRPFQATPTSHATALRLLVGASHDDRYEDAYSTPQSATTTAASISAVIPTHEGSSHTDHLLSSDGFDLYSRGAIPQHAVAILATDSEYTLRYTAMPVSDMYSTNIVDRTSYYARAHSLAALTLSLLILSMSASIWLPATLTYLLPLLVMPVLMPGKSRTATFKSLASATIVGTALSICNCTPSMNDVRQSLTQWTGSNSLASFARLLFCGTIVANLLAILQAIFQVSSGQAKLHNFSLSPQHSCSRRSSPNGKLSKSLTALEKMTQLSPWIRVV